MAFPSRRATPPRAGSVIALRQRHERLASRILGVVKVPLTPYQLATLVSFADNVGWGDPRTPGFSITTLLKKLNAGNYNAVPAQLARWVNNDGAKMQGLINRLAAEAGLRTKGEFGALGTGCCCAEGPPDCHQGERLLGPGIPSTLAALFVGDDPVQWALFVILLGSFASGAFFFIKSRVRPA